MADLHTKTKALMNQRRVLVMGYASQGVRSATKGVAGDARSAPDPEVAATAKRRQFSSKEKRHILAAADRRSEAGATGALLRREGIYREPEQRCCATKFANTGQTQSQLREPRPCGRRRPPLS
jgi:hypothetical protein